MARKIAVCFGIAGGHCTGPNKNLKLDRRPLEHCFPTFFLRCNPTALSDELNTTKCVHLNSSQTGCYLTLLTIFFNTVVTISLQYLSPTTIAKSLQRMPHNCNDSSLIPAGHLCCMLYPYQSPTVSGLPLHCQL